MHDLILKNGVLIDGTGTDAYTADVALKDGIISGIGKITGEAALKSIDITGKTVTPGFIDMHNHGDCEAHLFPDMESAVTQGITTLFTGHCGLSVAPIDKYYVGMFNDEAALAKIVPLPFQRTRPGFAPVVPTEKLKAVYKSVYGMNLDWSGWGEYLSSLEKRGVGANMVMLVGHAQIRHQAMGFDYKRVATDAEIDVMGGYLRDSLEVGGWGMSFGLDYSPGIYADKHELETLARIISEYGAILAAHTRSRPAGIYANTPNFSAFQGYEEFCEIGAASGAHIHISHIDAGYADLPNARLESASAELVLDMVDKYRSNGLNVTWDALPDHRYAIFFFPSLVGLLGPYVERCGSISAFIAALKNSWYRECIVSDLRDGRNPGRNIIGSIDCTARGWSEKLKIRSCKAEEYIGKSIKTAAEEAGKDDIDMLLDLIIVDSDTRALPDMPEGSLGLRHFAERLDATFGLDCGVCDFECNLEKDPNMPPRYAGGPTEFCGMVHLLTSGLIKRREDMIAKMTGNCAKTLGLPDRGFIKEGMRADLLVLDWDRLNANEDLVNAAAAPKGVEYVFINGMLAAEHGKPLNIRAGEIIRRSDDKRCI